VVREVYAWTPIWKVGVRVFSFLFKWSDVRWGRDRFFVFSPVYVSAKYEVVVGEGVFYDAEMYFAYEVRGAEGG